MYKVNVINNGHFLPKELSNILIENNLNYDLRITGLNYMTSMLFFNYEVSLNYALSSGRILSK